MLRSLHGPRSVSPSSSNTVSVDKLFQSVLKSRDHIIVTLMSSLTTLYRFWSTIGYGRHPIPYMISRLVICSVSTLNGDVKVTMLYVPTLIVSGQNKQSESTITIL